LLIADSSTSYELNKFRNSGHQSSGRCFPNFKTKSSLKNISSFGGFISAKTNINQP